MILYKKFITSILLILCLLCGCGEQKQEDTVKVVLDLIDIPLGSGKVFKLTLPEGSNIVETDNNVYWLLSDDTKIYRTTKVSNSEEDFDAETGMYIGNDYVAKDFDECTITAQGGNSQGEFRRLLFEGVVDTVDVALYKETKSKFLPSYVDMSDSMYLSDRNLYMPEGSNESSVGNYTAELLCNGVDFLESWIQDGDQDSLQGILATYTLVNAPDAYIASWFMDDDYMYFTAGDHIMGAKKLKRNQWYIYLGTTKYKDYILTGMHKVSSSN